MTVVQPFPAAKSGSSSHEPPALSTERIDRVRLRLRKHLNDTEEVSQAKVAKRVSLSNSTVSLFLAGTYAGDNSAVALAIENYLDLRDQQQSIGIGPKYVRTSIAARIERAIFMAEATSAVAVIATQSGLGKTKTIFDYRESHPSSIYFSAAPDLNTKWAVLSELCMVVTKDDSRRRSPAHARREIVSALAGTDRTLLVDESHFLVQECIDELRCIHDQARVALILLGNESTYEGFRNSAGGSRGMSSTAYTQFASRVVARLHLGAHDITAKDIRMVASQMIADAVVAEAMAMLQYEAANNGGFRRVVNICRIAQMLAQTKPVTKGHVVRAISELKQLGGGEE